RPRDRTTEAHLRAAVADGDRRLRVAPAAAPDLRRRIRARATQNAPPELIVAIRAGPRSRCAKARVRRWARARERAHELRPAVTGDAATRRTWVSACQPRRGPAGRRVSQRTK